VIIDKYVRALHRVRSIVDKADDTDLKENYNMTGDYCLAPLQDLLEATEEMEKYRSIIKEKAQKFAASV
jgi:hypothetical protein